MFTYMMLNISEKIFNSIQYCSSKLHIVCTCKLITFVLVYFFSCVDCLYISRIVDLHWSIVYQWIIGYFLWSIDELVCTLYQKCGSLFKYLNIVESKDNIAKFIFQNSVVYKSRPIDIWSNLKTISLNKIKRAYLSDISSRYTWITVKIILFISESTNNVRSLLELLKCCRQLN